MVETREEAAAKGVLSGTDLNCGSQYKGLVKAVEQGLIAEEDIDASVRRLMLARMKLGMFDPGLPACEDYDLWLRLCHRFPVHYLEEALIVKYGGHEDQLSRQHPAMDQFRVRSLHRLLREHDLSATQRAAATRELMTRLDILLKGASRHGNQALLEEFVPLREYWGKVATGAASC